MPNIMLTDSCNLSCPYCFANEFVNKSANEISIDNFISALDFILKDRRCRDIGLIGGEPALHSKFRDLLKLVNDDKRIQNVDIYTNGVLLDRYWDELCNKKVHLLINCNPPSATGTHNFQKICDNLAFMINHLDMKERLMLGINMYDVDFEYEYLLTLLDRYRFNNVRIAITVPNADGEHIPDARRYFLPYKKQMHAFFRELLKRRIEPIYDCNKLPRCLIDKDEWATYMQFNDFLDTPPYSEFDIRSESVRCAPVIDIMPDLTAVRCFGLSQYTKVHIGDFENLTDLKNYYAWSIDSFAYHTDSMSDCRNCYQQKTLNCMGGCLVYKIKQIMDVRSSIHNVKHSRPESCPNA